MNEITRKKRKMKAQNMVMIPVHSFIFSYFSSRTFLFFSLFPYARCDILLVCIIWKYTYKSVHDKLTSTWFTYAHTHKFYIFFILLLPYDLILLLALTLIQSYFILPIPSLTRCQCLYVLYEIVCNTPQAFTIFTVRAKLFR